MRRASATIARLDPRLRATCAAHVLGQVERPRCIMTVAAWHGARRRLTPPALVIPPGTSRSPDWFHEGVRPTHGPTFFEDVKRPGVIHRGPIGQCDHRTDPGHGHHAAAGRILLGKLADKAFQPGRLLSERQSPPQHRFG